ncbi:MAG: hypothetical protein WCK93_04695 [Nitrosomonadales bacterium]|jgi:hypothetical protein
MHQGPMGIRQSVLENSQSVLGWLLSETYMLQSGWQVQQSSLQVQQSGWQVQLSVKKVQQI